MEFSPCFRSSNCLAYDGRRQEPAGEKEIPPLPRKRFLFQGSCSEKKGDGGIRKRNRHEDEKENENTAKKNFSQGRIHSLVRVRAASFDAVNHSAEERVHQRSLQVESATPRHDYHVRNPSPSRPPDFPLPGVAAAPFIFGRQRTRTCFDIDGMKSHGAQLVKAVC